jgi:hypothetical protein
MKFTAPAAPPDGADNRRYVPKLLIKGQTLVGSKDDGVAFVYPE